MGMGEESDDMPALPQWVEDYFADQRERWRGLREDGIIDLAGTAEVIRRLVERPSRRQPASKPQSRMCTRRRFEGEEQE